MIHIIHVIHISLQSRDSICLKIVLELVSNVIIQIILLNIYFTLYGFLNDVYFHLSKSLKIKLFKIRCIFNTIYRSKKLEMMIKGTHHIPLQLLLPHTVISLCSIKLMSVSYFTTPYHQGNFTTGPRISFFKHHWFVFMLISINDIALP